MLNVKDYGKMILRNIYEETDNNSFSFNHDCMDDILDNGSSRNRYLSA